LNTAEKNILKTLAYFDIFDYPVLREELRIFHSDRSEAGVIDESLNNLCTDRLVFKLGEYFSLRNDPALSDRRRKGNHMAQLQLKTANRAASILSGFPFVKGLAVSGSLSKNFAEEKTDVDFFVITAANRLWIARTLLQIFYKLNVFTGRQSWFCLNYYVDEAGLEIVEKNLFTAIEIATLLPMYGKKTLDDFMKANEWKTKYFPLCIPDTASASSIRKGLFSRGVEHVLSGKVGNLLDNWLMRVTEKRWKKKVKKNHRNSKGIAIGMMVDKHFAKPNPAHFQDHIIGLYGSKLEQLHPFQPELSKVV
jgi:hypothetical protein